MINFDDNSSNQSVIIKWINEVNVHPGLYELIPNTLIRSISEQYSSLSSKTLFDPTKGNFPEAIDPSNLEHLIKSGVLQIGYLKENISSLLAHKLEVRKMYLILERVMRHIELNRKNALALTNPTTHGISNLESKVIISILLLRYSEFYRDPRYLNTALKLNDSIFEQKNKYPNSLLESLKMTSLAFQETLIKGFYHQ